MATLFPPVSPQHQFRRVAVLFAGGPAPAANAVISTAATSFLRYDVEVIGIKHGYSALIDYTVEKPLEVGRDYVHLTHDVLSRTRNSRGIMIGTARANPGKLVSEPGHLDDPERVAPLKRVYEGLCSLEVDALISIGGDDTLKTANKFKLFQEKLPEASKRIPVVHLPKTIDNDYHGIDFTFGFFTAVETLASEIRNLIYDAAAGRAYFICETMGRSAGWLAYGAAIAGEASLVISIEDVIGNFRTTETHQAAETGEIRTRDIMDVDAVIGHIVDMMLAREAAGKQYGIIVLAEGLAEYLPAGYIEGVSRDDHGHISISDINLSRLFAKRVAEVYENRTGRSRKVNGLQLGYESRCAPPHSFDVILGCQLGVGAYRALAVEGLDGVMVSVSGQFDLHFVPFDELVDQESLVTKVRYIEPGSDFHQLARYLETYSIAWHGAQTLGSQAAEE